MRRFLKVLALSVAILFASVQFVRPNRTNPPVDQAQAIESHLSVTPEVAAIFERACKDCHSNQTDWPWYSHITPVSWFLADHVEHGRKELNFSVWSSYDRDQADTLLNDICREAKQGTMPLSSYTLLHRSAKLSPRDVQTLCAWSKVERERLAKEKDKR